MCVWRRANVSSESIAAYGCSAVYNLQYLRAREIAGDITRDITERYHGAISRSDITERYHGEISREITERYHGEISRREITRDITERYHGEISRRDITERDHGDPYVTVRAGGIYNLQYLLPREGMIKHELVGGPPPPVEQGHLPREDNEANFTVSSNNCSMGCCKLPFPAMPTGWHATSCKVALCYHASSPTPFSPLSHSDRTGALARNTD